MLRSKKEENVFLTVGILGGGQLAKMLAAAAQKLGLRVHIFERFSDSPASRSCDREFVGSWRSWEVLRNFAHSCDVITIESEFVPSSTLHWLHSITPVCPDPVSLQRLQDKYEQKGVAQQAGFAVAPYRAVETEADVQAFAEQYGYPVVLKTRFLGYDGYGNRVVHQPSDIKSALRALQQREEHTGIFVEAFVNFQKELALVYTRDAKGHIRFYPLVETVQQDGICHKVFAPAVVDADVEKQVQQRAAQLADALRVVGTMAIELFLVDETTVLFNEIAPRVHNSGHFTIEACFTSQFENHIRAITGLPLGATEMIVPAAAMINILSTREGDPFPQNPAALLEVDKISVHFYSKERARPRRKMGHVTTVGETRQEVIDRIEQVAKVLQW